MSVQSVDILVVGGGIAGQSAAIAMGSAGFSVLCVDPVVPVTAPDAKGVDLRTTAFLQPSMRLLDEIGVWPALAGRASPLDRMRIVDAGGAEPQPRVVREFVAEEISTLPFGWNLPNWLLRDVMQRHIDGMDGVAFRTGVGFERMLTREGAAHVWLSDGSHWQARLVIGADGRNSAVRAAAGIGVKTTRYGQKAVTFAVTHPIPHEQVSTEIHRWGGPFTLVPLPDHDGRPCSAVVWMTDGREALSLAELEVDAFEAAITERSCQMFGPLTLVTGRGVWPIISQVADRLVSERVALVAEAAHVVPPIGAQGLNMSLADIAELRAAAMANPGALGSAGMLDGFARARHSDIRLRVAGIDLLNRASMARPPLLRAARARGIEAIYALPAVRRALMQMGLGARA